MDYGGESYEDRYVECGLLSHHYGHSWAGLCSLVTITDGLDTWPCSLHHLWYCSRVVSLIEARRF
jgi:hypothetical protein